jgi:hypothetical protein
MSIDRQVRWRTYISNIFSSWGLSSVCSGARIASWSTIQIEKQSSGSREMTPASGAMSSPDSNRLYSRAIFCAKRSTRYLTQSRAMSSNRLDFLYAFYPQRICWCLCKARACLNLLQDPPAFNQVQVLSFLWNSLVLESYWLEADCTLHESQYIKESDIANRSIDPHLVEMKNESIKAFPKRQTGDV